MKRLVAWTAWIFASSLVSVLAGQQTAFAGCAADVSFVNSTALCHYTAAEVKSLYASSTSSVRYMVELNCWSYNIGGMCNNPRMCAAPPNTLLYDILRSIDGAAFLRIGTACLNGDDIDDFEVITTEMVTRAFQELDWPSSPLIVQPPGGRTLVNLETNFSTTNTAPTTQSVTLLGQVVEIEATPASWLWHFTATDSLTTTSPGALYPDLEITHSYTTAEVTEHPSLDTGYHGRYRINGGAWQDIPQTHTVTGTPVDLQVLTATPVLVGGS